MNRLILMRHAKTEPWSESADDHARALTDRGVADAGLIGLELKRRSWMVDQALVSTARRARETWRVLGDIWPRASMVLEDDLYLAGPETLSEVLRRHGTGGTVLLVAHNPGLHEAACDIARASGAEGTPVFRKLVEKFPTGCAAFFEVSQKGPDTVYALEDVLHPLELR
ncbi:MAG: histidine phosphatase family protein [Pseudomonadota bacterium]